MIIHVASADDPRIAAYRAVRERDLAKQSGLFVVEGRIALERLIGSRFETQSLFLAENRIEPLTDLLAAFDPAIPVYMAAQGVMDSITGFHIHRGVLAMAKRDDTASVETILLRLPQTSTVLALIGLANHDNVGACFRNAAALGAGAILLDAASCDPLYRKSIRVSSGAVLQLPFAHAGDGASLLAALKQAGYETWALSPTDGAPLHHLTPPKRLAIVLGAEGPGLPAELIASAHRVSIPMSPGIDSLNVATAGAIALAHVRARQD